MKVLLTGYRGFIGKNFLEQMPSSWEVNLHEWGDEFPNVEGLDWVFHIGAISSTTETDIDKVMKQNLNFSIKLFESCILHNVNFQWSSSASVYGKCSKFSEDSEAKPENLYAMSKYLFEQYVLKRNPRNIKYQGFRYFNVYGPHEEHKGNQASPIHQFSKQAKEDKVIKVFEGSDNFRRDFVHVDKIINTHKRMTKSYECGVWNIGTGSTMSFRDIANIIAENTGAEVVEIPFPEHLVNHYQMFTEANTKRLEESLRKIKYLETRDKIKNLI